MKKQLVWNVFIYNSNDKDNGGINVYNVFNSLNLNQQLIKLKKELKKRKQPNKDYTKKDYEWFKEELRKSIAYCFWAKCEYETFISEPFPSISEDEWQKCKYLEEPGRVINISLRTGKKIDIYEQLLLNFDKFAYYIYENKRLIKER